MKWPRVGLQLAFGLAIGLAPLDAEDEAALESVGAVRSREIAGCKVIEVLAPGPVTDVEPFISPSGDRSLVLLVEASESPESARFLYELRLGEAVELSDLPVVLPAGADSVAVVDLEGDGAPELLVSEPGRIFRVTGEGKLEIALEAEGADLKGRARMAVDGSTVNARELVLATVGSARRYTLDERGRLLEIDEFRLPVRARMQGSWLRLSSSLVTALPRQESAGGLTYMVGPESIGNRRLRSLILEPERVSGPAVREAWSQLPTPETVEQSQYALLDGEVVLLVTTVQADKRGIFEKKKLRVLRLAEDRSRSGATPILQVLTRTRNWYQTGVGVFDVNQDDIDDVVLIQPKGLGGGKLVVEAFMGSGSGQFAQKTRRTDLEIETEIWDYGKDLNLDGVPDLVVIEDETLLVFTGAGKGASRLVVHPEAEWSISIGRVNDSMRVDDVLGDSRPEVLLIENERMDIRTKEVTFGERRDAEPPDDQQEPNRGGLSLVVFAVPDGH